MNKKPNVAGSAGGASTGASTPTAGSNWANRGKANALAIPTSTRIKASRELTPAVVQSFTPHSYSTGSFGVKLCYAVEGLTRDVYENIVLKKIDHNTGEFTAVKGAEARLAIRLRAFGLNSEALNAFPIPTSVKSESEAYDFSGTPVLVELGSHEYEGKTFNDIVSVWPVDAQDGGEAA